MVQNYYQTAIENEEIFRNVLRDLRDHRKERPMGRYVPEDLETEADLHDIFSRYSQVRGKKSCPSLESSVAQTVARRTKLPFL